MWSIRSLRLLLLVGAYLVLFPPILSADQECIQGQDCMYHCEDVCGGAPAEGMCCCATAPGNTMCACICPGEGGGRTCEQIGGTFPCWG